MAWKQYRLQKEQVSTDAGRTWADVTPYTARNGEMLGTFNTYDECMNMQYRWVEAGDERCDYVIDENTMLAMTYNYSGTPFTFGVDCNEDGVMKNGEYENNYNAQFHQYIDYFDEVTHIHIGDCCTTISGNPTYNEDTVFSRFTFNCDEVVFGKNLTLFIDRFYSPFNKGRIDKLTFNNINKLTVYPGICKYVDTRHIDVNSGAVEFRGVIDSGKTSIVEDLNINTTNTQLTDFYNTDYIFYNILNIFVPDELYDNYISGTTIGSISDLCWHGIPYVVPLSYKHLSSTIYYVDGDERHTYFQPNTIQAYFDIFSGDNKTISSIIVNEPTRVFSYSQNTSVSTSNSL